LPDLDNTLTDDLCLSIITWTQVGYWQDSFTLLDHTLEVTDNNLPIYINRGADYLTHGDNIFGCRDAQKACELGNCKLLEMAKGKGDCR